MWDRIPDGEGECTRCGMVYLMMMDSVQRVGEGT